LREREAILQATDGPYKYSIADHVPIAARRAISSVKWDACGSCSLFRGPQPTGHTRVMERGGSGIHCSSAQLHRRRHHARRRPRPSACEYVTTICHDYESSICRTCSPTKPNAALRPGLRRRSSRDTVRWRQVNRGANVSNWQAAAREGKEMKCCVAAG
jgi:hypothetical protein